MAIQLTNGASSQVSIEKGKRFLEWRSLVLGGLVGALGTLCCVSIIALTALGVMSGQRSSQNADKSSRTPSATLNVDADGCTVVRSEVESSDPVRGLQWVITDESGRQVLARNALGENSYSCFRPGQYDVVLQTLYNGRYIDISGHVKIACPKEGQDLHGVGD